MTERFRPKPTIMAKTMCVWLSESSAGRGTVTFVSIVPSSVGMKTA